MIAAALRRCLDADDDSLRQVFRQHSAAIFAALEDSDRLNWLCRLMDSYDHLAIAVYRNGRQEFAWVSGEAMLADIDRVMAIDAARSAP